MAGLGTNPQTPDPEADALSIKNTELGEFAVFQTLILIFPKIGEIASCEKYIHREGMYSYWIK